MICEVVNFKEEGLVTPEGGEGKKGILKINWSIKPQSPVQKDIGIIWIRLAKCPINESFNLTSPSLPQNEVINIGHKSLPIIIGPY